VDQNIIGIFSGKGGVGKTTLTLNLAAALSQLKKNVLAIDADFKMCSLSLHLGLYQFPVTIKDVLLSQKNLLEAIYIHPSGVRIIPAPLYVRDIDSWKLKEVLSSDFISENYVLLDSPPGLEKNVFDVIDACNSALIITTPDIPAVTDALKIVKELMDRSVAIKGVVVNMNDGNGIGVEEIEETLELPVLSVIPFDKDVRKSLLRKEPLMSYNPYSPAAVEIKRLACLIAGERYTQDRFLLLKRLLKGIKK